MSGGARKRIRMTEPVLYSFRRCPYAMRARMALSVSGAAYEHREVVLRDKPPAMLIEESRDIMRWALEQADPEGWLERRDQALVAANDGPFKHHLDRYKYATRYDDVDPQEHRSAALEVLQRLENRLEGGDYLCGDRRGFADIAIFPFIRQFANADRPWFDAQKLPKLQSWLEGLVSIALFTGIMTKHPQWHEAGAD